MKTPALIMFGTQDTNVPTGQGWQHFRAMQQAGVAPVRFPGQALAQEEEDQRGARLDRPLPCLTGPSEACFSGRMTLMEGTQP